MFNRYLYLCIFFEPINSGKGKPPAPTPTTPGFELAVGLIGILLVFSLVVIGIGVYLVKMFLSE